MHREGITRVLVIDGGSTWKRSFYVFAESKFHKYFGNSFNFICSVNVVLLTSKREKSVFYSLQATGMEGKRMVAESDDKT